MGNQIKLPTYLVCFLLIVTGALGLATVSVKAQLTMFVPNCDGIDDTAAFTTLIDEAAGNQRTIRIPYKADLTTRCKVTTMTFPANITLDNTDGSGIALDSPNVVTVLGAVVNSVGKTLFFGTGTTSFDGNTFVGLSGQARISNGAGVDTWGTPGGLVPETRSVSTTSPLTGGGDLTADRTIACDTCAVTTNPLSQFAATTSAQLASVISGGTGSGALVFGTSPTFTTSIIDPMVIGGTANTSTLTLAPSNAAGATNGSDIIFKVGPSGGTEAMRIRNTLTGSGSIARVSIDQGLKVGNWITGSTGQNAFFGNSVGTFLQQPVNGAIIFRKSNGAVFWTLDKFGNQLLGTPTSPTANSGKVLAFGDNGATNPTMGANTAGLFAKDVSGTTELFAIDEAGNSTQLTGSGGGGGGASPSGADGDLQMKSGLGLAPSAINDDGTVLGVTRPFELRTSLTNIARWTLNGDNTLSFAATPVGSTTLAERLRINATGDLLLGTTDSPTANSGKVLALGENGATNPTMGSNTAGLFAKDVSGTTRLFAIDEDGSTKQLTGSDAVADGATKGIASFAAGDFDSSGGNITLDYTNGQAASGSQNGFLSSADWTTFNGKQADLGFIPENSVNKSTNTSLGTSNTLYPTQNAVKTYVDNHVGGGGGGGASPSGDDGDLQMKSGAGLAPSAINDDGSVLSVSRPFELRQADNNFARLTFNGNGSLSVAATLAAPTTPAASLLTDATGSCTSGTHQFKVTYITAEGETNASTPSNSVTCDASKTKVTITLPTGSTTNGTNTIATGRNIYATKAGGSTYFRIAPSPVVNNNTATSYTFSIADSSFGPTEAPTVNSAVDPRIFVDHLGNVGFGTTSPQFTDDSQGRSVAIDGGSAEGYLGIGATSVTNVTGRVGALNFYNIAQGGVDHRVAAIMAFNDGALGKGQMVFMTSAGIIGPSGAGSINSEQNWGIGRNAVTGVKLIVQAGSTSPTDRVFSINNSIGSAAFVNVWNDGKVQLANGKLQVDAGPFQVDSNGEVTGRSFKLTSAPRPACNSSARGKVWYVAGAAGVKDTVEVCAKNASDVYAWRVIY